MPCVCCHKIHHPSFYLPFTAWIQINFCVPWKVVIAMIYTGGTRWMECKISHPHPGHGRCLGSQVTLPNSSCLECQTPEIHLRNIKAVWWCSKQQVDELFGPIMITDVLTQDVFYCFTKNCCHYTLNQWLLCTWRLIHWIIWINYSVLYGQFMNERFHKAQKKEG